MYQEKPKADEIAMWIRKSKSGMTFMSGVVKIEGKDYDVTLFKNNYKGENPKAPDYVWKNKEKKDGWKSASFVPDEHKDDVVFGLDGEPVPF
jgi:hypothetical protein